MTAAAMFEWWGEPLPLFDHPYNTTALNERAVEIPCALRWLEGRTGRGLEVGNVLRHYGWIGFRVIDRYEKGGAIDNIDVFEVTGSYDWIVSISTLEHVRWDEEPHDPNGSVDALLHLRTLLKPDGGMLVTVPLGWQSTLDSYLLEGDHGARRACTFVRVDGAWRQTERPTWRPYGQTDKWAGSVWIGEWGAP